MMGAGTGGLLIIRWFWWRINAYCEIVAMIVSFTTAVVLSGKVAGISFFDEWSNSSKIIAGVVVTTLSWLITAFFTPKTDEKTLRSFVEKVNPDGPGWKKIHSDAQNAGVTLNTDCAADSLPKGILCMVLGCVSVYSLLFSIGYCIYSRVGLCIGLGVLSIISTVVLFKVWMKRDQNN